MDWNNLSRPSTLYFIKSVVAAKATMCGISVMWQWNAIKQLICFVMYSMGSRVMLGPNDV